MNPKIPGITRRTVLRGLGATIALPYLEIMGGMTFAAASGEKEPSRLACFYIPGGINHYNWFPGRRRPELHAGPVAQAARASPGSVFGADESLAHRRANQRARASLQLAYGAQHQPYARRDDQYDFDGPGRRPIPWADLCAVAWFSRSATAWGQQRSPEIAWASIFPRPPTTAASSSGCSRRLTKTNSKKPRLASNSIAASSTLPWVR